MQDAKISRNPHYTFKYNLSSGRHGWLRLTPAYSVKLVEDILSELDYIPQCVLEPFSGTGTTELVCANKGIFSLALEINPFLVWFGNVKLKSFSQETIDNFLEIANTIVQKLENTEPAPLPPIHNIDRWWGKQQADFLAKLKTRIYQISDYKVQELLLVSFCRAVIEFSNAAFNHVSTSFRENNDTFFSMCIGKEFFLSICKMIAKSAEMSPKAISNLIQYDSRGIPSEYCNKYDTVITSPPYPNRISYIRELRPYMYWMDYLKIPEQASELDWKSIGGTWGKATSLLSTWKSANILPSYVHDITSSIAKADNRSAGLMANYVLRYFEDIYIHLKAVYAGLLSNGKVFYIIGNSNFYGISVPAERIYADLMTQIGFTNVDYQIVRKRNCNKHLYEFIITGEKT